MKCGHKEADNRILFHINHVIKDQNYTKIIVASPDTGVFVSFLFHLTRWTYMGSSKMRVLSGRGLTKGAVRFHRIVAVLDISVIDVLPAIHALTGCDTTNTIGTKRAALKLGETGRSEILISFGKEPLTWDVTEAAEKFFVGCISNKSDAETFDELRYKLYHYNSVKFDLGTLLPTLTSIEKRIKRAYYQCYVWMNIAFLPNIDINPPEYSYLLKDGKFLPETKCQELPVDFPIPCSCLKYARANICPCRRKLIPCFTLWKCSKNNACKNNFN